MNTQSNNELVAEIHEAFYSADERLLQEAKDLLANPAGDKAAKAERIKRLGFGKAQPVKETAERTALASKASSTIKTIEYWRTYYPNNKFITEPEVKRICEKYGLVLGEAGNYLGDIPEKNISEIEAFELRKEDWAQKAVVSLMGIFINQYFSIPEPPVFESETFGLLSSKPRRTGQRQDEDYIRQLAFFSGNDPFAIAKLIKEQPATPNKKAEKECPAFKICAPQKDFHTSGYVLKEGYILVYDPVVLQPVKDGYLIVSAWGMEASDELVINHNQN
jgi:hypothetical protein